MASTITLGSPEASHAFCVGDVCTFNGETESLVVAVDHAAGRLTVAPATRWRRAWYWLRGLGKSLARNARCYWADLFGRED